MSSISLRAGLALIVLPLAACSDAATAPVPAATSAVQPATELRGAPIFVAVSLGDLGGGSALARNINGLGVVVGSSMTAGGEVHAFVWSRKDGMRDLGTLGKDDRSDALAINLLGEIVGTSGDRAVRWDRHGHLSRLRAPGAERAAATDINIAGVVSGWVVYPPAGATPRRQLPVRWNRNGSMTALGVPDPHHEGEAVAVNDRGVIAATVGLDIGHGTHAATWQDAQGWHLLEPQLSDGRAVDMNLSGDVVGVDLGQPFNPPPILWRHDGTMRNLSPAGGDVRGINVLGQMAGRAVLEEGGFRMPVMWRRNLTLLPLPVPAAVSSVVNAISDLGEIVGGIGSEAVIWTRHSATIPQPIIAATASRAVATGGAGASLPAWLLPEHQRCTRSVGPLRPGEPVCGDRR